MAQKIEEVLMKIVNKVSEVVKSFKVKVKDTITKVSLKSPFQEKPIVKLLSDEDRYNGDKLIIDNAIQEKDWETLEDMLKSSTSDFPDLIKLIENALKNK